jgi:hypothetical protein
MRRLADRPARKIALAVRGMMAALVITKAPVLT